MEASFNGSIKEISVMLVHHNTKFDSKMADLLESYKYKVMTVNMALAVMSMLSKEKEKIDVMIINVHSPDSFCFKLLKQAVALDIVPLFVCEEYNELTAKKAFDNGAFLYLKKSLDKDIVKYLWQFILKKKIQREKVRGLDANGDHMKYVDDIGNENIIGDKEQVEEKNMPINTEEQNNNIYDAENNMVSKQKYKLRSKRGKKGKKEIYEGKRQRSAIYKIIKRNDCLEWTVDLHAKFTKVAQELDEGSNKLRSKRGRKRKKGINEGKRQNNSIYKIVKRNDCTEWTVDLHAKFTKVAQEHEGSCLPKEVRKIMNGSGLTRMQVASHLQKCPINNWRPLEKRSVNTNSIFASSTQQQRLYHPQLQVQPCYLNQFLFVQNNDGGGVQQQYEPLFHSQGPIIGTNNSKHDIIFNSGDHHDYNFNHHTQNDYSLDLNLPHVTTYSSHAIMSDTDVGNAIMSELGVTNANFQQYIGEQNMTDSSNIVAASNASDIEENNSNEWENCDVYFNFDNMDDLDQNLGAPSPTLPKKHDS